MTTNLDRFFAVNGSYPPIMGGAPGTGSVNMFIRGASTPLFSSANLNITGATPGSGGRTFYAPLTISGTPPNKSLNLFVNGMSTGGTTTYLPLIINGGYNSVYGTAPLFVQNNSGGITKSLKLSIKGTGLNTGYIPHDEALNLFIQRGPNAGIELFICNTQTVKSVPLFISGSIRISTTPFNIYSGGALYGRDRYRRHTFGPDIIRNPSPTLFIEGFGALETDSITMFIAGSVPQVITGQTTLVIPSVSGPVFATTTLYTHGFRY